MDWRFLAGTVILSFATCALLMKLSDGRVSVGAGILCFGFSTFVASLMFFCWNWYVGEVQQVTWNGASILLIAGGINLLGDLAFILALRYGAKLAVLSPLVDAGAVLATTTLAWLIFKEAITVKQFFGILMGVGSICLLAIG